MLSVVQDNAIKLVIILQAMDKEKCVGAIVCKLDMHKKMVRRGYIAMLAVDSDYRRNNIGTVCYIVLPRLSRKRGTLNLIRLSVRHKNFNLAHIFWSINDRTLIFGMHDPCDKPFHLVPCHSVTLTYFKVKDVAGWGTTILWICMLLLMIDLYIVF